MRDDCIISRVDYKDLRSRYTAAQEAFRYIRDIARDGIGREIYGTRKTLAEIVKTAERHLAGEPGAA
jgi:hypothetical protein